MFEMYFNCMKECPVVIFTLRSLKTVSVITVKMKISIITLNRRLGTS